MSADPYIGLVLKDRYAVEREIGRGGIGSVYFARDRQLHARPVVVKVLRERSSNAEWVLKKFREEIRALARIDHPGVVGALDAGEMPDGNPYIVLQYVDGVPLRKLLGGGQIPLDRVAHLVRQIGQALGAAHDKGVVHRDLKPENVMVQTPGPGEEYARLIDFGIASVVDQTTADAAGTAGAGAVTTVAGTVYYMAPEQLQGRPVPASDVYAMGVVAYELVTGTFPFKPATPWELLELQRAGVRTPPSALRPDLPREAEAAILKALAFSPADRYASARVFGEELSRALLAAAPPAPTPGRPDTQVVGSKETSGPLRPADTGAEIYDAFRAAPVTIRDVPSEPPEPVEPRPSRLPLVAVAAAGLLLLAAGAVWLLMPPPAPPVASEPPAANTAPPAANTAPPPAPAPVPARELSYSILVQKYRDGRPYEEPFMVSGEMLFERDYRLRLNVSSPQEGHLYILNEGEPAPDGLPSFNYLFPSPTANEGSSRLAANTPVQFPARSWIVFDEKVTVERLWLVWSETPVEELEEIKGVANPVDRGAITDPVHLATVRRFFAEQSAQKPEVDRDPSKRSTTLRRQGRLLAHVVPLEHN